jgi:hypothetical protein
MSNRNQTETVLRSAATIVVTLALQALFVLLATGG